MNIRAVLCDIYNTLLAVGPPPADSAERWDALCRKTSPQSPSIELAEFAAACERVIKNEHAAARATGISHPEVFWPDVARAAWPALAPLNSRALDDFLFEHAQLQRTLQLMPGAAEELRSLAARNVVLGLVSNSQPYTLRELDAVLSSTGLSRALFATDLCFFSFEHGFSKPDAHVFRLLTARLARRGIAPAETLIVGDREDNDIRPARAAGFQTWLLSAQPPGVEAGDWASLNAALLAR